MLAMSRKMCNCYPIYNLINGYAEKTYGVKKCFTLMPTLSIYYSEYIAPC